MAGGFEATEGPGIEQPVRAPEGRTPAERRAHRVRIVQIALGCIWILDAALQFQPRMFGHDFINDMILPNAQRPTPNAQRPTPNAQRPTPNAQGPARPAGLVDHERRALHAA